MQIVIDIPEKAYTYIKREWEGFDYDSPVVHVFNGVKNGVVIPKGHGRLIDADAFERKIMFGDEEDLQDVIYSLRDYEAVLEADNGGKDIMDETLKDYTKIVVETDEENPVTVATITKESIDMAEGYRVRLTPKYD